MTPYRAPIRDLRFVLHELLDVCSDAAENGVTPVEPDTVDQVLDAAGRFASQVLAPLNPVGDAEGCSMPEPGIVKTPTGFKRAYQQYVDAEWPSLGCEPAHGGQGFAFAINAAVAEIFVGANLAWKSYPGMSHAAYRCLLANGSAQQQATYLPKLASGEWAGTMCLTEAQCGTDLGLLRTKAVEQPDGSYAVTGTKIFISGGEHDLTDNIVHLVLARLSDAPPGVKGISLLVVPKFLPHAGGADGGLGARNGVSCGSIEHKMGIRGNATCTMNFDGAKGWLVGKPNAGLAAMFVMMNHARLGVGINAVGQMEAAYQKALAYAKDRRQGRAVQGRTDAAAAADPIIMHADVRRMLLTQKAYLEGTRALILWVAQVSDRSHAAADPETRQQFASLVALLTPVVKAYTSDAAVECTSLAIQVFGGHGYIRESGVEQHLRDCRIIPLYEGSNGIQAQDLLKRKVLLDGGAALGRLTALMSDCVRELRGTDGGLHELAQPLEQAVGLLQDITRTVSANAATQPDGEGAVAVPYLRLVGHVCLAWMWARMARVAQLERARASDADPIYASKIATARFYFAKILPEVFALAKVIEAGAAAVMDVEESLL